MLSDFSFAEDTIGFIIEGDVDKKVTHELGKAIYETLKENSKMSLYLEDMSIRSFTTRAILIGALFPFKYGKKFNKLALISDRKWLHIFGYLQNALTGVKVRTFTSKKRLDGMSWIMDR